VEIDVENMLDGAASAVRDPIKLVEGHIRLGSQNRETLLKLEAYLVKELERVRKRLAE